MDPIHYSEFSATCGLDADGNAVVDGTHRPARALAAPTGELIVSAPPAEGLSVGITPLAPDTRLAADTIPMSAADINDDGTVQLLLPDNQCTVIVIDWQAGTRTGRYVALAALDPAMCNP
jgi:hypothetical protein